MSSDPHVPAVLMAPALNEAASFIERTLETLLPQPAGPQARLVAQMRAATLKQERGYRTFFVLQSGRLFGVDRQPLGRVAAAVECVAAASRLALSSGAQELTLTGEALFAEAFALLGSADAIADPFVRAELMLQLAHCAGHSGLLGGLSAELGAGSDDGAQSLPQISRQQRMKTAALIGFCCEAGPVLAKASPPARHALSAYGQDAGLALHIALELSQPEQSGATPSVVSALGPERARAQGQALAEQAIRHLDLFDEKADLLRAAADFAVARRV